MDPQLSEALVSALMQGRQAATQLLGGSEITLSEMVAMRKIANNSPKSNDNVYADDLQGLLFISKPAISQMFKSLERRGLIRREINLHNRRKLVITLTGAGRAALERTRDYYAALIGDIIAAFGEARTRELVTLYTAFNDTIVDMAKQAGKEVNA